MTNRKFHCYVVQVEIISEDPWTDEQLHDLACIKEAITDGDSSGTVKLRRYNELNGLQTAKILQRQGSDPAFFGLDDKGNDLEEDHTP